MRSWPDFERAKLHAMVRATILRVEVHAAEIRVDVAIQGLCKLVLDDADAYSRAEHPDTAPPDITRLSFRRCSSELGRRCGWWSTTVVAQAEPTGA